MPTVTTSTGPETVYGSFRPWREAADFGHDWLEAVYEVVEASPGGRSQRDHRMFLGLGKRGLYLLKFGLAMGAVVASRDAGRADWPERLRKEHELAARRQAALADVIWDCGSLVILGLGLVVAPAGGIVVVAATGLVGGFRCGVAIDKYRSALQGVRSAWESPEGKAVEWTVDVLDAGLGIHAAVQGARRGYRALRRLGGGTGLAHADAWRHVARIEISKLLLLEFPGLVLHGDDLLSGSRWRGLPLLQATDFLRERLAGETPAALPPLGNVRFNLFDFLRETIPGHPGWPTLWE